MNAMARGARKGVVLFGDSITQGSYQTDFAGWGGRMSNHLCRVADVYNRGFSGYNSRWALQALPLIIEGIVADISIVVIFFGANDAVTSDDVQHVPLDEYRSNIRSMIDMFRAHNSAVSVIIVTPPPVDSCRWSTRHNSQVSTYADAIRSTALEKSVELVDLWEHPISFDAEDLDDGLHLSVSGNAKVFNGVIKAMSNTWPCVVGKPGRDVSKDMPMHFPSWKALAGTNSDDSQAVIDSWRWDKNYFNDETANDKEQT
jgi:isoamyl acetate esterase